MLRIIDRCFAVVCPRDAPEIGLVKESIYSEDDRCRFNGITVPAT